MESVMVPYSELAASAMSVASLSAGGKPASIWMFVYIIFCMLEFVTLTIWKFCRKDIT